MQARLKWLLDIEKTSGCNEKSSLPRKKIWLIHLFRAMGVPGDEGECSKGRVVQERRGFDELNAKLQALNCKVSGVRCQEKETENSVVSSQ
jgi:hypothetical protein